MMLALLLEEIATAGRPLTAVDLAVRLGIDTSEVMGMLAALRAAGRLAPDAAAGPASCVGGSCGGACPGPAECPLVTGTGLDMLEPRSG
jgi:hypothetical protein